FGSRIAPSQDQENRVRKRRQVAALQNATQAYFGRDCLIASAFGLRVLPGGTRSAQQDSLLPTNRAGRGALRLRRARKARGLRAPALVRIPCKAMPGPP